MDRRRHAEWWRPEITLAEPAAPGSAAPFWGLMAFTFILLLAPQSFFPALAPLRIALLTAGLAIATHLFDRFIHRQPIVTPTREMWVTACLLGWALLTVPFSYWPGGSASFLLAVYLKTLTIFWLLTGVVNSLPRLRRVAWGLSLMAVPVAAAGVNQYLSGKFIPGAVVSRVIGYDAPLAENPNDLALLLNLILPLTLALFLVQQKAVGRMVLLACLGLDAMAVILTFSRAGFITLATIFGTYVWRLLKRPERGWAIAALVLALASTPLLPSSYLDRLSTITSIEDDPTGSAQARWTDAIAAVQFVLRHPIVGAGVGMNILALNQMRGPAWKEVHNVYLEYAVDLGLPGLVLFLALLTGCIRSARDVQRRSAGVPALREVFTLAESVEISLVAFAVAGLFHPVAYHFYFYYMAGLAVALKAAFKPEGQGPRPDRDGLGAG